MSKTRFDKIDGFIISLNGKIKHLILFDHYLIMDCLIKFVIRLNRL